MQDWYAKKTLGTLLDEAAGRWSAREALTYEGQRWSFAALQTELDRTARAFLALGLQAGERVALWQSDATTLMTVDRSGPVDSLAMVHELCPSLTSSRPGQLHVESFPQLRHVVILGAHPGPGALRLREMPVRIAHTPSCGVVCRARGTSTPSSWRSRR
jgi:fatty-acyl-CoA synthase